MRLALIERINNCVREFSDSSLFRAQAAHNRAMVEMSNRVALRRHGNCQTGQGHAHQGREAQKLFGPLQRCFQFRAGITDTLDAELPLILLFHSIAEGLDGIHVTPYQQAILHTAAR